MSFLNNFCFDSVEKLVNSTIFLVPETQLLFNGARSEEDEGFEFFVLAALLFLLMFLFQYIDDYVDDYKKKEEVEKKDQKETDEKT